MALKTRLGKADYESLEESLKSHYVADGDGYKLDADYEDVTGLKAKRDELLREVKKLQEKYGDLDPEAARTALETVNKAEEERRRAEGDFETWRKEILTKHRDELKAKQDAHESLLATLKREQLTNTLTAKGVLPDRVKYLVPELDAQIELEAGESGFRLKKKGGIGDDVEFEAMLENVRQTSPFFFQSQTQTGGGASGSGNNAGSGKQMPEAQFDSLSPQEQASFVGGGGTVI